MAPADLEVGRVVPRRDLERARRELGVDELVRDHGHAALDVRNDDLLAHGVAVALVVGVHGHGHVGQDRRRPHRGDRDRPGSVRERVPRVGQPVVHRLVDDLEVGDGGLVEGAPVDDAVRAIDPAAPPEVHEEAHDGLDVGVVHGEALALVVERGTEAAVLAHDRAARLLEVAPHPLDEGLPSDLLAGRALADELLLDHVLRRDPGVVVAGLPERVEAAHAVPADEHVLERAVERVAHVERARHVGRRDADHERLVPARAGARPVVALLLPGALPALLEVRGRVRLLHRHDCTAVPAGLSRGPSGWRRRARRGRTASGRRRRRRSGPATPSPGRGRAR